MGEEKGENRGRAYVVDGVRQVAPLLFSALFVQCERERDTSAIPVLSVSFNVVFRSHIRTRSLSV